jgi:hypothetical protein
VARFRSRCKIMQKIEPKSAAVQILRSSCNTYSYINYRWRRLGTWYRTAVIDILLHFEHNVSRKIHISVSTVCFVVLSLFELLSFNA